MSTKNNQWPDQMPILKAIDFEHDSWENRYAKSGAWCGTTRCMVGWVGSVFHNDALIAPKLSELSEPCRRFLLKLAELAGFPADKDVSDWDLTHHVSNIFEGIYTDQMPAKDAAKLWRKTLRAFGYTQLVDVK